MTLDTIRLYLKEMAKYKWVYILMVFASILAVMTDLIGIQVFSDLFGVLIQGLDGDASQLKNDAWFYILFFLGIGLVNWVLRRLQGWAHGYSQPRIVGQLGKNCFDYLHRHNKSFFEGEFVGSLVKKVNAFRQSFGKIQDLVLYNFLPIVVKAMFMLAMLFSFQMIYGLIMLIWISFFIALNAVASVIKLKYDKARTKALTKLTAHLADTFTNAETVKLFAGLKREGEKFGESIDDSVHKIQLSWGINLIVDGLQHMSIILFQFAILYFVYLSWLDGTLIVEDVLAIQLYLFTLIGSIWSLGRMMRDTYEAFVDANEMTELLTKPHEIVDVKKAKKLVVRHGRLDFSGVNFTYKNGVRAISDFDLKVKPGERVALIGPSGGGKSTIVKLLLRFYDIQQGQILIDGQDISQVKQESLRENIALVPQDPVLFHRTLMDNIRYGRTEASNKEVLAASKMAFCHEFIERLPDGYQSLVGERGVKLSGGQRQRIAIARAILSNAKILVLDEATSALDSESEKYIKQAMDNLVKNRTMIVIAHRLSTVMSADNIIVLNEGRIIERGTHGDLVNKKGSMYGKLWDLQVGEYDE